MDCFRQKLKVLTSHKSSFEFLIIFVPIWFIFETRTLSIFGDNNPYLVFLKLPKISPVVMDFTLVMQFYKKKFFTIWKLEISVLHCSRIFNKSNIWCCTTATATPITTPGCLKSRIDRAPLRDTEEANTDCLHPVVFQFWKFACFCAPYD